MQQQNEDGSWSEADFTGTGFPCVFYLKYHLYRNSFPGLRAGALPQSGAPARPKNSAPSNSSRTNSGCAADSKAQMKFPLRLSAGSASQQSRCARFAGGQRPLDDSHLSPAVFSARRSEEIDAESDPNAALMEIPASMVSQTSAPILWIGGDEPLQHPVIGRIAAALNRAGRNVFLHTDGLQLAPAHSRISSRPASVSDG